MSQLLVFGRELFVLDLAHLAVFQFIRSKSNCCNMYYAQL